MKSQPNRDYVSNDEVQTPPALARRIVGHFLPAGRILEPCCGSGNFLRFMPGADWCEVIKGRDFLATPISGFGRGYDWIVTNPPWSKIRPFLTHAMMVADNVVFLLTVNHVWTKARVSDVHAAGFGLKEIMLLDMPKEFPQSGFQLGAVHFKRGWTGDIRLTR